MPTPIQNPIQNHSQTADTSDAKFSKRFSKSLNSNLSNQQPPSQKPSGIKNKNKPKNKSKNILVKILSFLGNLWKKYHNIVKILIILGLIALAIAGTFVSIWVMARYEETPSVKNKVQNPKEGSVVLDRNGKELFKLSNVDQDREIVGLKDIPVEMQLALIGLEQENFYEDEVGIPWKNLVGAAFECLRPDGGECRGASGLSQQLIKNVTGDNSPTLQRKFKEMLTSIKFNREVENNKETVLELYLNWVPFGRNKYGIQAASKSFFGHGINDKDEDGELLLTIPKACYLASMPQRPTTFTQGVNLEIKNRKTKDKKQKIKNPNWNLLEARKNACIEKLHSIKFKELPPIVRTEAKMEEYMQEKVKFLPQANKELKYGHIRNFVLQELEQKIEINDVRTNDYEIHTTFDKDIQDNIEKIVANNVDKWVVGKGANNVASVVLDGPTGGIVAMVGSRDFNNEEIDGQVNLATASRQPGSSFKPYIYAAAFENNFNPSTLLLDQETDFGGGYKPKNFDKTTKGPVSIRYSLQNSLNIPAVKAAYLIKNTKNTPSTTTAVREAQNFAEKVGVKFARDCKDITLTLGSCEVEMLSHTTGINTLLQGGTLKPATPFKKILFKKRNLITGQQESKDVYNKDANYAEKKGMEDFAAKQIADTLSDYNARTWRNKKRLQLDGWTGANAVAAKTGTTSDVRDAWTVGGSPYYTVSVWVGNTDNSAMSQSATGLSSAAPIWKDIMTAMHKDKKKKGFDKSKLKPVRIDQKTGLIAKEEGGQMEYLTAQQTSLLDEATKKFETSGYNPLEESIFTNRTSVAYQTVEINKVDGKIANPEIEFTEEIQSQIIEEKACDQIISEFPQNSRWLGDPEESKEKSKQESEITEEGQQQEEEESSCPSEISTLTEEDIKPNITTNIKANTKAPRPLIMVDVDTLIEDSQIEKITLKIDGETVDSIKKLNEMRYRVGASSTFSEDAVVIIEVVDSFGIKTSKQFLNVDFSSDTDDEDEDDDDSEEDEDNNYSDDNNGSDDSDDDTDPPSTTEPQLLTKRDLSRLAINCVDAKLGEATSCNVILDTGKILPADFTVFIGQNQLGASCTSEGVCMQVPTSDNAPAKDVRVRASITKDYKDSIPTVSILELQ